MPFRTIPLVLAISFTLFAAESITKFSAPFALPAAGTVSRFVPAKEVNSFACHYQMPGGRRGVTFSWDLPGTTREIRGSITVCNLSGATIKRIAISGRQGVIVWDGAAGRGVYVAHFSCDAFSGWTMLAL